MNILGCEYGVKQCDKLKCVANIHGMCEVDECIGEIISLHKCEIGTYSAAKLYNMSKHAFTKHSSVDPSDEEEIIDLR